MIDDKTIKLFSKIDTVVGLCEECEEETILVAIVQEFYRCTNCGHDTKQHVNGRIRYMKLSESDKTFIKNYNG
jgi:uncharacterized protein (DUF983 family)